MYERQGTREGPEAPVESIRGLGVAVTVSPERRLYDRRATLGTATEIAHHLAVLLALAGERRCARCGAVMRRESAWVCPACGERAPIAESRHFLDLDLRGGVPEVPRRRHVAGAESGQAHHPP